MLNYIMIYFVLLRYTIYVKLCAYIYIYTYINLCTHKVIMYAWIILIIGTQKISVFWLRGKLSCVERLWPSRPKNAGAEGAKS